MKRMTLVLAMVLAGLLLAGCSTLTHLDDLTSSSGSGCRHSQGLILILGAHRNVPQPELGPGLVCQLTAAIRAGKPVRLVVDSSQPTLIAPQLDNSTNRSLAQQNSPWPQQDLRRVQKLIAAARPRSPGVNALEALSVAADEARTLASPHAELVLIDSGLDDCGALNFTEPGMIAATPAEVASQLKSSGNLPDLRGFTVVLVGLGYTAPPQVPLSAKWRSNVTQIWAVTLRMAGAQVEIIPQPGGGPPTPTSQPAQAVPVPSTQPVTVTTRAPLVFTGESAVRFEPNTTVFADAATAVRALAPIARWLAAVPSRHAYLEGTTADVGPMSGQIELSLLRADRVRDELIALGASPGQTTTAGAGSDFPQFIPDRTSTGILLPGPATLDRSVRIILK
jgi:outer membrane protein OmpA-like peptidoglycan-associated protein